MASRSIPSLLETLSNEKSFESTDTILGSQTLLRNSRQFPLLNCSNDYTGAKLSRTFVSKKDTLYLKILEAACNGQDETFLQLYNSSNSHYKSFSDEILNRLDACQGVSPLHYASLNGHFSVAKLLIESGADVDIWDEAKRLTPLMCAAAHGNVGIMKLLLQYKCEIDAGLNDPQSLASSALLWAVRSNQPQAVQVLLEHGANQNSAILYSETPVHAAVINGSCKILEMLLNAKGFSNVDFCMGSVKNSPLHLAASGDYPNAVANSVILLEQGRASVDAKNARGRTPLHLAGNAHDVDLVELLLLYGADSDSQDNEGRTPLFEVISDDGDAWKCLKAFCEDGKCNVNHQDKQGYTPLHFAAFKEARAAAQLLLMHGADFSLRSDGGFSSLSILRRKIPTTDKLISNVFDKAIKVSYQPSASTAENDETFEGAQQNCKVKVNYNFVVASSPAPSNSMHGSSAKHKFEQPFYIDYSKSESSKKAHGLKLYKETSKIKCLVDENMSSLLLHPVVQSFLVLKWQKVRPIFFTTFIFKAILVILFSVYVQLPYLLGDKPTDKLSKAEILQRNMELTDDIANNITCNETCLPDKAGFKGDVPNWFLLMYIIIVTMATINGLVELSQIIRAPKSQLLSLEPWIFLTVLLIMIFYMSPTTWGKTGQLFHRSMAAMAVCLTWIDIWIYMGRSPTFGLSIRVFFKVLQNFSLFIAPHFCLLAGFVLSFTILFPFDCEYSSVFTSMAKAVRIMAGDNELPEAVKKLEHESVSPEDMMSYFLIVYIYTGYVLTVGIVLSNMLIGLAVNDIQGIYAEASMNRLTKQTILLNTLDASFNGKWILPWIPKGFLNKHVNLFSSSSQSLVLTFRPYDKRDKKLSANLKLALINVSGVTQNVTKSTSNKIETEESPPTSTHVQRWTDVVNKLISSKENEHKILMKKVNSLVDKVNLLIETMEKTNNANVKF